MDDKEKPSCYNCVHVWFGRPSLWCNQTKSGRYRKMSDEMVSRTEKYGCKRFKPKHMQESE